MFCVFLVLVKGKNPKSNPFFDFKTFFLYICNFFFIFPLRKSLNMVDGLDFGLFCCNVLLKIPLPMLVRRVKRDENHGEALAM